MWRIFKHLQRSWLCFVGQRANDAACVVALRFPASDRLPVAYLARPFGVPLCFGILCTQRRAALDLLFQTVYRQLMPG